jgi:hypothetical protein
MSRPLNFEYLFRGSTTELKKSYILMVPSILVSLIGKVLLYKYLGPSGIMDADPQIEPEAAFNLIAILLGVFTLGIFAHGVTVAMALELREKGETSLNTAWTVAIKFLPRFLTMSVFITLSILIGFTLYVLPGIAVAMFLMFSFPATIVHNLGAFDSIKRSVLMVKANTKDSFMLFTFLIFTYLFVVVAVIPFVIIPPVGVVVSTLASGLVGAVFSIVVLKAFLFLEESKVQSEDLSPPTEH